jgi:hypothetical protein
MTESEIAALRELTEKQSWRKVIDIVEPLARRRLEGSLYPLFEPLLIVQQYVIYKYAITVVGKMRQPPAAAFDAVLAAWQSTWIGNCPQCTIEALNALLKLDQTDPRIIDEITRCLAVDNYQVHKACATALMSINDERSRQVLRDFESYLPRHYTERLMLDLLEKIRAHLAA